VSANTTLDNNGDPNAKYTTNRSKSGTQGYEDIDKSDKK